MLLLEKLIAEVDGRRLLDGIDLVVRRGEFLAAVTDDAPRRRILIELLVGRRRPDGGRVRVDGLDPARDGRLLAHRIVTISGPRPTTGGNDHDSLRVPLRLDGSPRGDVWLLDEPTSGSDAAATDRFVADLIDLHLRWRPTALLLTGDPHLAARVCGQVVHLA